MPENLTLSVQQANSSPGSGWAQCADYDGTNPIAGFWYKYDGGNGVAGTDPPGSFEAPFPRHVPLIVNVTLSASPIWNSNPGDDGFRIAGLVYTPANGDLSYSSSAANKCVIRDKNDVEVDDGQFAIIVAHRSSSGVVTSGLYCHPNWRNKGGDGTMGKKPNSVREDKGLKGS